VSLCLAGNYDGVPLTFFANITTSVLMNESCRKKPMITDNPALWLLAVTDPGMVYARKMQSKIFSIC
jgi:hypothetical protein